ncbi:MAG: hypothetical protein ACK5P5_03550, partial [Pseudobdellovibrionaceae bacterium]
TLFYATHSGQFHVVLVLLVGSEVSIPFLCLNLLPLLPAGQTRGFNEVIRSNNHRLIIDLSVSVHACGYLFSI